MLCHAMLLSPGLLLHDTKFSLLVKKGSPWQRNVVLWKKIPLEEGRGGEEKEKEGICSHYLNSPLVPLPLFTFLTGDGPYGNVLLLWWSPVACFFPLHSFSSLLFTRVPYWYLFLAGWLCLALAGKMFDGGWRFWGGGEKRKEKERKKKRKAWRYECWETVGTWLQYRIWLRSFRQRIIIPHCRSWNTLARSLLFLPFLPPSLCFSKARELENELRNDYSHDSGSSHSESYFDRHSLAREAKKERYGATELNPLSPLSVR